LPATFAAAPAMRIYCAQFGRRKRSAQARRRGADLFYDASTFSGGGRCIFNWISPFASNYKFVPFRSEICRSSFSANSLTY